MYGETYGERDRERGIGREGRRGIGTEGGREGRREGREGRERKRVEGECTLEIERRGRVG